MSIVVNILGGLMAALLSVLMTGSVTAGLAAYITIRVLLAASEKKEKKKREEENALFEGHYEEERSFW